MNPELVTALVDLLNLVYLAGLVGCFWLMIRVLS